MVQHLPCKFDPLEPVFLKQTNKQKTLGVVTHTRMPREIHKGVTLDPLASQPHLLGEL